MADDREYEVEIVDDSAAYVDDAAPEVTASPEDKAATQAKAEQAQEGGRQQLSGKQRRNKLKERIDELTRKYRDEERQRYQVEREREDEREQFQQHRQSFQQEQQNSAKIVFSTLADNKRLLESHLETARSRGDTQTENQIQDKLTEVRERMGRLRQGYPGVESDAPAAEQPGTGRMQPQAERQRPQQEATPQPTPQPAVPDAAKDWISSNKWLNERPELHATVNAFDAALKAQGKDPATAEFYQALTAKLKTEFPQDAAEKLRVSDLDDIDDLLGADDDEPDDQPDAAAQARQEQRPAPTPSSGVSDSGRAAPRNAGGKRKVTLNRDEQATAQRLGVSNEEYAKYKVRSESSTGYHYVE